MSKSYTRFIITGDARTGSNMLAQALNTNPGIRCFREIFNGMQDYVDYFVEGLDPANRSDLELRNSDPVRFLETRIFTDQPVQYTAVGFKYLYGHFWGFDAVTEYLRADRDLLVVHLKRRNMLRSLVSVQLAEATNKWIEDWGTPRKRRLSVRAASAVRHPARTIQRLRRKPDNAGRLQKPKVAISKDDCERWFFRTNHEVTRTDELFASQNVLEVWYEDMLVERNAEFARVQQFVGVQPVTLTVTLRRQNPEPLRELISNYDELRAAFAGTPEEAFFDD